jgi:uracil-DNA glycosylase
MPTLGPRADLESHLAALRACDRCPRLHRPAIVGRAAVSRILLVGQAPGGKEPKLGRPFAWTAGRTLFGWFHDALGWTEEEARDRIYLAAVCRCFPGKRPTGGDRVPAPDEIANCSGGLEREFELLRPVLVLPVGKLAIGQFLGERPSGRSGRDFGSPIADKRPTVFPCRIRRGLHRGIAWNPEKRCWDRHWGWWRSTRR